MRRCHVKWWPINLHTRVGAPIGTVLCSWLRVTTHRHRCGKCIKYFHAMCAYEVSQSDDPNDCGCTKRSLSTVTTNVSAVPQALRPPKDMPSNLLHAWQASVAVTLTLESTLRITPPQRPILGRPERRPFGLGLRPSGGVLVFLCVMSLAL